MNAVSPKASPCLGFLTVIENADIGLIGGYLLLNASGRPLEFHCTAPVKANRTQEILYGPTLQPYLYGEQIGQTLLAKSKLAPLVVCTDSESVLAVRNFTEVPVVLLLNATAPRSFPLGANEAITAPQFADDERKIRDNWPAEAEHLDLLEPFTRIREALDEAQRTPRQAA
jgi:hypothetical protein